MTTADKCEAIIRRMTELANEKGAVTLEEDMGGNTLTVYVGPAHTHVGCPGESFDLLVENLYNSLHGGPGLSWFDPTHVSPAPGEPKDAGENAAS